MLVIRQDLSTDYADYADLSGRQDFLVLPQRNRLRIPRGKLCPFPDERDKKQSPSAKRGCNRSRDLLIS